MRDSFFKYIRRNWSKWILALITLNILIFIFVMKNPSLTFYSNSYENRLYQMNNRINGLLKEIQIEISENRKFMKTLINILEAVDTKGEAPDQKVNILSKFSRETPDRNPYKYCSNNVIPILVITCNRPSGLERTLRQLINYRTASKYGVDQFPIYISQGCNHKPTEELVAKYKANVSGTLLYQQKDDVLLKVVKVKRMLGYFKIADHYKYAIDWVLGLKNNTDSFQLYTNENLLHPDSLLIVEDDLDISPDFFSYFRATNSILKADASLFCVSAWNDNGKSNLVDSNATEQLYRTDFFPGLGWMMLRSFWYEIRDKWPNTFWDEYLRQPEVRKNRQCIRPEIPRTATFGRKGVSNGQFFDKHLKFLLLNAKFTDFCRCNLTYIASEASYREMWQHLVYDRATLLSLTQFLQPDGKPLPDFVRIEYESNKQFSEYAKKLSLMDDIKSGVQRSAYRGVVTFMNHGTRVFLAPNRAWTQYSVS